MQYDEINTFLDEKIIKTGIPVFAADDNVSDYVNMSMEDLQKISSHKAGDIAFKLEASAANIQSMSNRLKAHLVYVESNLNKAFARVSANYDSFNGKEVNFAKACLEHQDINDLSELKLRLQMELIDIENIQNHLKRMSVLVENMKWRNR